MKFFDYFYQKDFGHEFYFNILSFKNLNVIQTEIFWDECPIPTPYLILSFFGHYDSFIGLSIGFGKFKISLDFLAYHPKNLNHWRKYY